MEMQQRQSGLDFFGEHSKKKEENDTKEKHQNGQKRREVPEKKKLKEDWMPKPKKKRWP